MAYPVLTGAVLIEANGAALNNAGLDEGVRVDNATKVKEIRIGRLRYPYVSGQAWRRWWREVLYTDFNWKPSEVVREEKSVHTKGDPITYEEDDLFGYMVARKRKKDEKNNVIGTYKRVSPLRTSLLVSVLPNVITNDFGHFSRNLPPGADPVLFESELYTTYLQGVFTISLTDVGRFVVGEGKDIPPDIVKQETEEVQDLSESEEEKHDAQDSKKSSKKSAKKGQDCQVYLLPKDERIRRVQDVVRALSRLRGGANLSRKLSDVSPVVVLIGFIDGGNAPFQNIFMPDEKYERVLLNLPRLRSILVEYADRLLTTGSNTGSNNTSSNKAIFFGYHPTVLANEEEVLKQFQEDEIFNRCIEVAGTPRQAFEKAANMVKDIF